jgi:hypothetical protein
MTAQQHSECLVLTGPSVIILSRLADAGLTALERSNGYAAGAHVRELVHVLRRTAVDVQASAAMSARGPLDASDPALATPLGQSPEIGTEIAGSLLGLTERQVRRKALDLGGRQVSGRWVFDRQAITTAAQQRQKRNRQ